MIETGTTVGVSNAASGAALRSLVVRAANRTCALNLDHVIEIMRPLPVEHVAGAPEAVLGLSVIRGTPIPVVALAALFDTGGGSPTRFVIVRAAGNQVALAVDAVLGIREFTPAAYHAMPRLLRDARVQAVEEIGALDSELLFVLDAGNLLPEALLESLAGQEH